MGGVAPFPIRHAVQPARIEALHMAEAGLEGGSRHGGLAFDNAVILAIDRRTQE
ncbi:MAG: hypothetical protein AMXMBFR66_28670 [Pseudomonadota bacterium]